jgi:Rap1a immunity proteins
MKTLTLITAAALSLLAATSPALSATKGGNSGKTTTTTSKVKDPESGSDWLRLCITTQPQSWDEAATIINYCLIYPRGMADGLSIWMYASSETARVCIPQKVTSGQLRDVALEYIKANPKDRHLQYSELFLYAWQDAWPCENKTATTQSNPSNQTKKTDAAPVELPRAE